MSKCKTEKLDGDSIILKHRHKDATSSKTLWLVLG